MKYNMNTEEYWKTGLVDDWVPMYRHWLTAYKITDESDLDEENKENEKDVLRRCKVRIRKDGHGYVVTTSRTLDGTLVWTLNSLNNFILFLAA